MESLNTVIPPKTKRLVIIGAGEFAKIAYEYFTYDSSFEVVAFAVEKEFCDSSEINGIPLISIEDLYQQYSSNDCFVYVAITYTKLNQVRERIYLTLKGKGYKFATYISSRAFVWHNAVVGENTFIFENNTIQPFCKIGNNVVLWSGNHIGHRTLINDHCYLSSHIVVSGFCEIGERCFIGVNSSFADSVKIADDIFVSMGSGITRSFESSNIILKGYPALELKKLSAKKFMKADEST